MSAPTTESGPLDQAIAKYLALVDAGDPVDRGQFLREHSEVAEELQAFWDVSDRVEQMAGPQAGSDDGRTMLNRARATGARDTAESMALETQRPSRLRKGEQVSLPHEFGRYRLTKLLGEGAMGSVYLAYDSQLERDVALKMPKFDGDDRQRLIERFYTEARAAATLSHPNLCPVYDVGEFEGRHFLTMSLVNGQTLSRYIGSEHRQSEKHVVALVRKLALALQEAHQKGIVHRDLKPGNIMIDQRGEPIVMDFGLARRFDDARGAQLRATQSGELIGTPAYMSPEQVEGAPDEIGPATDIYSLGVIFFELLTARLPFTGSVGSVMGQILHKEPPDVLELRPDTDPRLAQMCRRMMSKKVEDRFESMGEVAEWLSMVLRSQMATPVKEKTPAKQKKSTSSAAASPPPAVTVKSFKSEDRVALADAARACIRKHDYAQASELLQKVPGSYRDDEIQELLKKSTELQEEVDFLIADMEEAVRLKQYEGLKTNVKRLLKLKPGYKPAKQLLEELNTYSTGEMKRRDSDGPSRYHKDEGILRPLILGGLFVALLFAGAWFGITYYLKTTAGTVRVTVYDPSVTVELDKEELRLVDDGVTTTVRMGEHSLHVDAPGLNAEVLDFMVERGEDKVFRVELVEGELAIVEGMAGAGDRSSPDALLAGTESPEPADTSAATAAAPRQATSPNAVFLRELPPLDVRVRFGLWCRDATVDGEHFEHGLLTHIWSGESLDSYVSYNVDGRASDFRGAVALNDAAGGQAVKELFFSIVGDGNVLWRSGPIQHPGDREDFVVDVTGVHRLDLRCESESHDRAHGAWLDPQLLGTGIRVNLVPPAPIVTEFEEHAGTVAAVDISADGQLVASGGNDRTIRISDASTGRALRLLEGHESLVWTVDFHPEGQLLASGGNDGTIRFWEVESGEQLAELTDHPGRVRRLKFSPDGSRLVSCGSEVIVWDVETRRPIQTFDDVTTPFYAAAFSPDGSVVAFTGNDQKIRVRSVETGRESASLDMEDVGYCLDFDDGGESVVCGTRGGDIVIWDLETQEVTSIEQAQSASVSGMAVIPGTDRLVTTGWSGMVRIWDLNTHEMVDQWYGAHRRGEIDLACNDEFRIVVGGTMIRDGSQSGSVRIWHPAAAARRSPAAESPAADDSDSVFLTELPPLDVHSEIGLRFNDVSSNGDVSPHGIITHPGKSEPPFAFVKYEIRQFAHQFVGAVGVNDTASRDVPTALNFSIIGDGEELWRSGALQQLGETEDFVVDVTGVHELELRCESASINYAHGAWFEPELTGSDIRTRLVQPAPDVTELAGHASRVLAVATSTDGTLVASAGDDQTIRVWDVASGQALQTLRGFSGRIWALAFDPESGVLASGGNEQVVRLWDLNTGESLAELTGHTGVVRRLEFSADGAVLASCAREVIVWDVERRRTRQTFDQVPTSYWGIAFSPDSRFIAYTGDDRKIHLGSVNTGRERALLDLQHVGWCVDFSLDGESIFCGTSAGTVIVWNVDTQQTQEIQQAETIGINGLKVIPGADRFVTTGYSGMVKIWDLQSHEVVDRWYGGNVKYDIACSSEPTVIVGEQYPPVVKIWRPAAAP